MKKPYERLIEYSKYPTASDDSSDTVPSTPSQLEFGRALAEEMKSIGMQDVSMDENGYVFGTIPASKGYEDADTIGFLAHNDVVREVPFENVKARVVECNGESVVLNPEKGIVTTLADCPDLARLKGKHLVVTDGTTLLGADDKAGTAVIMYAAERLLAGEAVHGRIRIGFTPDEEIGRGPDHFDVKAFDAKYAYTLDGGR
ncbi:MAG: peptidase T, partial [Oscillospiraceae bacterium]